MITGLETLLKFSRIMETSLTKTENNKIDRKTQKDRLSWFLLLILLPLAAYFWFGIKHLDKFETADEHLWVSDFYTGRIQNYWEAVTQKDWPKTKINDKPGITLAFVSGIGSRFEHDVREKIITKENLWSIYNPKKNAETYYFYRLPILIFNGLMSLFFLLSFWRLTKNSWLALFATAFILLSPILIGISQIINPDSLLWVFTFASLLSFFLFLKETRFVDGFLTALFLGLALLSKYVAIVFIPFFLVSFVVYFLFNYSDLIEKNILRKKIIIAALSYPIIISGSIGLYALLMPAAIVDPNIIYKSIINFGGMYAILQICIGTVAFILLDALLLKSFVVKFLAKNLQFLKIILPKVLYFSLVILAVATIANWSFKPDFLHIPSFEVGGGKRDLLTHLPFYQQMVLQSKTLFFSLTPITLLLILFVWIKSIFKKSILDYIIFMLSLFFLVFFVAVTKQGLLIHIRYSVILYPFALALAGFGFYELVKNLKQYYSFALFAVIIGISIWNIKTIEPFYFNYTNDLLPKRSIITTAWGYGGYEAVDFINKQGDPNKMKIWTNYYGVCPFFSGKCSTEGQAKWMKDAEILNINYVVLSQAGVNKNLSGLKRINEIFPTDNPVWELDIDGRPENFIKVYKNPLKQ